VTGNKCITGWEYATFLIPRLKDQESVPEWPPDVFGICMALLMQSGGYTVALNDWPPVDSDEDWAEVASNVGQSWRKSWAIGSGAPNEVRELWVKIRPHLDKSIEELKSDTKGCQILLQLAAFADSACEGVGLPREGKTTSIDQKFWDHADDLVTNTSNSSNVAEEIHCSRARVLPKMRTPQNGLTVRSLSHNLALCVSGELQPKWHLVPNYPDEQCLNILVVPWPYQIDPVQFEKESPFSTEMRNMPANFGFFGFRHTEREPDPVEHITSLFDRARQQMGSMHGVILPELALTPELYASLRSEIVDERESFLISGVTTPRTVKTHSKNEVFFDIPTLETIKQGKHHRWKLDPNQLTQYSLGSRLHTGKLWWEHIDVSARELTFVSMLPWLVVCVLICEDLARPDPVGDLVRAVGPNLVIALLMDGPQIRPRWSARCAATLADDPGCSVLCVTSLGMSQLSHPVESTSANRSRCVALWKDAFSSNAREIELPIGAGALVLSISESYIEQWSADGRSDSGVTGCPLLSGVREL